MRRWRPGGRSWCVTPRSPAGVGWRAVLAEPGRGTAVRSDVTSADPTRRLHVYPTALLASPADRTRRPSAGESRERDGHRAARGRQRRRRRPTAARATASARSSSARPHGQGVLLLLLLAAFGWGAVHALSPGHGKAMVAAYLVGARGTARHAVALGLTVTITHTIGVFALGAVALALSAYVLPEQLYPWLNLVSGLLVLGVGASVVRTRVRARARARRRPRPMSTITTTTTATATAMTTGTATTTSRPRPTCARARCWRWERRPGSSPALRRSSCSSARWPSTRSGWAWSSSSRSPPGWPRRSPASGLLVVAAGRVSTRLSGARAGRVLAVLPALSAIAIVGVGLALTAQAVPKVL